jgi:Flp pilus assembly protein CpaB
MAEQVVWNKKLLVVSLLLGIVAAGLFYAYDTIQQRRARGEIVQVLRWESDLKAGTVVSSEDVQAIDLPAGRSSLEGVARPDELPLIEGQPLIRSVKANSMVYLSDVDDRRQTRPSHAISEGMRGFPLRVDPNYTPGQMVQVNDRVDVLGVVPVQGRPRPYLLVENLRVTGVGGRSPKPDEDFAADPGDPGARIYRSVVVEVSPEVATQLANLLLRVQGKVWLLVRHPTDMESQFSGRINPELRSLLGEPLPIDYSDM